MMKKFLIAGLLLVAASTTSLAAEDNDSLECLAENMYHEARGQEPNGIIAVGFVVVNRVKSKSYPNDICSVVKQGGETRLYRCQFSWWCDGRSDKITDIKSYKRVMHYAQMVIEGTANDPTLGAIFYHTKNVNPYWAPTRTKTVQIGEHIFYR